MYINSGLPGAPGLAVFETRDFAPINDRPVPVITARTNFRFLLWCHALGLRALAR